MRGVPISLIGSWALVAASACGPAAPLPLTPARLEPASPGRWLLLTDDGARLPAAARAALLDALEAGQGVAVTVRRGAVTGACPVPGNASVRSREGAPAVRVEVPGGAPVTVPELPAPGQVVDVAPLATVDVSVPSGLSAEEVGASCAGATHLLTWLDEGAVRHRRTTLIHGPLRVRLRPLAGAAALRERYSSLVERKPHEQLMAARGLERLFRVECGDDGARCGDGPRRALEAGEAFARAGQETQRAVPLMELAARAVGPVAADATFALARLQERRGEAAAALRAYRSFLAAAPAGAATAEARERVVVLSRLLEAPARFRQEADAFLDAAAVQRPDAALRTLITLTEADLADGRGPEALARLEARRRLLGRGALHLRLKAHALAAATARQLRDDAGGERSQALDRQARQHEARILARWRRPAAVIAATRKAGPRALGIALEARAAALLGQADRALAHAALDAPPVYRGPGQQRDVADFVKAQLVPWVQARHRRLLKLKANYEAVVRPPASLPRSAVPPRWALVAGHRVMTLYGDFVAQLRTAPMPKRYQQDDALWAAYTRRLAMVTEPWRREARGAAELCLAAFRQHQLPMPEAADCLTWLAREYPREFEVIDGVFADAAFTPQRPDLHGRPLPW